jgi:hypothetical protein
MTHSNITHMSESFKKNTSQKHSFQTHQLAFTNWIRHADHAPLPNNVSTKHMTIYRELVFNNISSFIEHTYPVTQALLPAEIWQDLINIFFKYGQCDSPYYYDISLHFKDFLDQDTSKTLPQNHESEWLEIIHQDYPWLRELMQYEWMELYVDMADVAWLDDHSSESNVSDLSTQPFKLKTTCWVLAYQYPVHTWSTDTSLADIQLTPTCLLIYRNQSYDIQIHSLHPLWAYFIETMQSQEVSEFTTLASQLQKTTQLAKEMINETLINLLNWLKTLTLLHVIPIESKSK